MAIVLIIEDEPILARNLRDAVQLAGHEATIASSGEQGLEIIETLRPHVVLTDYGLPGMDGLEVLRRVRRSQPIVDCIVITAHGDVAMAVAAMKAGAADFLSKPLDLHLLCVTIDRILGRQHEIGELSYRRERERQASAVDNIIGESPAVREVRNLIRRIGELPTVASNRPPCVLITGETGTGKDLVSRAIHHCGPRRDAQFVHVNCTAIGEHLAESELFGHVKGAFTDARSDKRGLFELADKGTLFLDEIGHMPLPLQAKLLTAIDQRAIRPVGATQERKIDVHLIAATNRQLDEACAEGDFREDLYHRLRVVTIKLSPLRERGNDVEVLARNFLHVHAARSGSLAEDFSPDAIEAIRAYDWPGNVRELSHTIERAVLFADGPLIRPIHLNLQEAQGKEHVAVEIPGSTSIRLDFSENCPTLEEVESQIIQAALKFSSHNLTRAAQILGISRDAIRYRIERFQRRSNNPE